MIESNNISPVSDSKSQASNNPCAVSFFVVRKHDSAALWEFSPQRTEPFYFTALVRLPRRRPRLRRLNARFSGRSPQRCKALVSFGSCWCKARQLGSSASLSSDGGSHVGARDLCG